MVEICKQTAKVEHKNSDNCLITEYPGQDKQISFAIAKISARYPEKGFATNLICKEIAYVQSGNGKVFVNDVEYQLNTGDMVLIDANEKFYWDGDMILHLSCSPAFTPEQHVYIA